MHVADKGDKLTKHRSDRLDPGGVIIRNHIIIDSHSVHCQVQSWRDNDLSDTSSRCAESVAADCLDCTHEDD